ncbi:MAG: amidohydrolase family protein [Proteobacteria bacterium]|nr:amidohydrolase family protein [Pseudomonadota bacterium]
MWLLMLGSALAECTLIRGADVVLPTGTKSVDVLVRGDEIKRVGKDIAGAEACVQVDGTDKILTTGLIDANTSLGLIEVNLEGGTRDTGGTGPSTRVVDGYNPLSSVIPVTRNGGITSALAVPTGGGIRGQSALVDLAGTTQADAVVDDAVAFYTGIGSSAGQTLATLRIQLEDARLYARSKSAYDRDQLRDLSLPRQDLAALAPLLDGDMPLVVSADRASDIEALLRFADEQDIRIVIDGAAEGWLLADELAAADVAVMLNPFVYGSGSFDQIHGREDNAALLHAAGVDVVFASGSAHHSRELRQTAGNAVRGGLDHQAAFQAITSTPARVFGLERGVLEAGEVANLVLWSGDPLEVTTSVEALWIRGKNIPLRSRHTELRDRYSDLPGSPVAPVPLEAP